MLLAATIAKLLILKIDKMSGRSIGVAVLEDFASLSKGVDKFVRVGGCMGSC